MKDAEIKNQILKKENRQRFSKEEIFNISELGETLRGIRARLLKDGISIDEARARFLQ